MTLVYVLVGVVVVVGGAVIAIFNGLVRLRNEVKNAWAQIDVQLQRRHDLIPNLVETVKGYAKHEREVFENVTKARASAMSASGAHAQGMAENLLTRALGGMMAVVENYPDLKASQNFLALQEELASTENKIAFARQYHNDAVMRLNTKIQMFPSNIVASIFAFKPAEFFEVEEMAARSAPKVGMGG